MLDSTVCFTFLAKQKLSLLFLTDDKPESNVIIDKKRSLNDMYSISFSASVLLRRRLKQLKTFKALF